jgi:hypothetical protein
MTPEDAALYHSTKNCGYIRGMALEITASLFRRRLPGTLTAVVNRLWLLTSPLQYVSFNS